MTTTPGGTPALTPEQAKAELQSLRTAPYGSGETDDMRTDKILALSRVAYSQEPVLESTLLAPPDLTPGGPPLGTKPEDLGLPALPKGQTWAVSQALAFHVAAESMAVPRHYVTDAYGKLAEGAHNMARGERYSVQRLKEELSRKYNAAQIDDIDIFAGEVMPHLPAGLRGDLERSGLLYYPPFFEKLAAIGERLRDGTTEQGMARLKEIYSEEE